MRIRNLNLIDARKKEAKSGEPRPRRLESEPILKEARVGLDTSQPRSPNRISTAHSLLSAAKIGSPNYQSLYRSASTGPESIQGPIGRRDKSRAQRLSHDRRRARLAAWSAWMQVASPIAPEGVAAAGRRLELLRQRMMMRHPRLHRKALRWRMELLKQKMIMRLRRQRPRRLERSRLQ